MRYFSFVSLLLLAASCATPYRHLTAVSNGTAKEMDLLKPQFTTALYRCTADGGFLFKKFHLSGILFLKNASDTATRVVFQNEMGITYFDFSWDKNDSFRVNFIVDKMDQPALIATLKKDFELLLVKNLNPETQQNFQNEKQQQVIRFTLKKGFAYYFLNQDGLLETIENADKKRKVVVLKINPPVVNGQLPQKVVLDHLRAHFSISLQKLDQDAIE